jgi:hypothetical protein
MNENVDILREIIVKEEKMLDILLNAIENETERKEHETIDTDSE